MIGKIDLKDKKLLYEIDFNSRIPINQLAKKIGLSKQGTEYKLNNLIKKGIIKGFYPVINIPKLGYIYCRLGITFNNTTLKKEKEIINYLKNNKKFFWIFTTQGSQDVLSAIWVKSIKEFRETIIDFMNKFGKYLKLKDESITTEVIHYQHRYLLNKKETKEINIQETNEKYTLNNKEKELLKILVEDPRIQITKLADKMKTTPKVAAYTLKKLEKEKIIEAYRPIIDHLKLGYTYHKLWINLKYENKKQLETLYNFIKQNPLVVYVVKGVSFPEDLDIEIIVKDNFQLYNFVKELKQKFPTLIGDYKTFMFIETKKVRYLPF